MLHSKWKLFAFGHYFNTNGLTVTEVLKLFDELVSANSAYGCEELLQQAALLAKLWPLETVENVIADMYTLAMHAQEVENMEI